MRERVLDILRGELSGVAEFEGLLSCFSQAGGSSVLLRGYMLRGYSAKNLETLRYDVCQLFGISHRDILEYERVEQEQEAESLLGEEEQLPSGAVDYESEVKKKIEQAVGEMSVEERAGFSYAVSYPFLREVDCPNEFKILVHDAISAYHRFLARHEELFSLVSNEQFVDEAELYRVAYDLLQDFELNQEIHQELEHYAKTGEILGEHPIFEDLRLSREVAAMSLEDLAKGRHNIKTYISKKNKALANEENFENRDKIEQEIALLRKKRVLIDERLQGE